MHFLPPPVWKQILRKNFNQWDKLADFLELTSEQRSCFFINKKFPLSIPLRLAEKIQKGTLEDPILKQFIPTIQEKAKKLDFIQDPVGDMSCRKSSKLLQKYEGRALLICTSACAMHCRYCFRQNFNYDVKDQIFDEELALIASDVSLREVILSGGDPLSLSNVNLQHLLEKISKIDHIKRIRFHTRFPIGIPERIDDGFLSILENISQQIWFVIHSNHPKELDVDVLAVLKKLQKIGVTIMNQAVLLKGVNDSVHTLKLLCERLVDHGIIPYYLHQLDRVEGAAHFEVKEEDGIALVEELRKQLSGYAVPLYVREIYGEPSKTPLL